MPKLNPDNYVKAERDVMGSEILEFADAGEIVESTFKNADGSSKMNFNIRVIMPDGEKRTLSMNKTSQKMCIEKYGKDTERWVGRKVKVNIGITPQGKKCIYVQPLE